MGRKITLWNYLRVDLYRSIVSWRFLAGILGISFTMYFASLEGKASDPSGQSVDSEGTDTPVLQQSCHAGKLPSPPGSHHG